MLWRCKFGEKIPFILWIGVGIVFKALKNEVIRESCVEKAPCAMWWDFWLAHPR